MTLQEAIDILKIHQQWRLGADIEMLEPKKISEAINVIILQFTQQEISDEEALRLAKEINKQPMTFVPYEITDEEIEKADDGSYDRLSFSDGAKWYREQLKIKQ
jgi:hypothetical protein